jgi:hypothetical protein
VDIGEEDDDFASGGEELGDLEGGDIVSGVRAAGRGGSCRNSVQMSLCSLIFGSWEKWAVITPVDTRIAPLGENLLDQFRVDDLGEVLGDNVVSRFRSGVHFDGSHCDSSRV